MQQGAAMPGPVASRCLFFPACWMLAMFVLGSAHWQDGPPAGPSDMAFCPVTGVNLTITGATPNIEFNNGQKLYFASEVAADAYRQTPQAFWLSPFESHLPMPDGARGLPDLRGSTLRCPYSNEVIDVGMKSIRVDHRHGQAVYFCCNGCVTRFWSHPQSAFASKNEMLDAKDSGAVLKLQDGPPPGPSNIALCPVTGAKLTITDATPFVDFHNGQKLYFANKSAAETYRKEPQSFWLSPFESPLSMPDGARGLPDLRGSTLRCPYSNEVIEVGMKSMRVVHRHGQAVYFCCHGCVTRFWSHPQTAFSTNTGNKITMV